MTKKRKRLKLSDGLIHNACQTVKRIWKDSRPNFVAKLTPEEFHLSARDAAINWLEMRDQLIDEGVPALEADNEARREWVVLPDHGEMEAYDSDTLD